MNGQSVIIDRLASRILISKRIAVKPDGSPSEEKKSELEIITKVISEILSLIDEVNNAPEFTYQFFGQRVEEFIVADEWKDYFIPESVRLDPTDLKTKDLLVRKTSNVSNDIQKYSRWLDLQIRVRTWYKTDLSKNTTSLNNIRTKKALFDVLPIMCVTKKDTDIDELSVHSIDEPFVPIRLDSGMRNLYRSDYWNTSVSQILTDYTNKFMGFILGQPSKL